MSIISQENWKKTKTIKKLLTQGLKEGPKSHDTKE